MPKEPWYVDAFGTLLLLFIAILCGLIILYLFFGMVSAVLTG